MTPSSMHENHILHVPFGLNSTDLHSMGNSLIGYLEMKVHHEIDEKQYSDIVVVGNYDRHGMISSKEKTGKLFNFQRPTAAPSVDGRTLVIQCYPSRDYVRHYASLIKTHLDLKKSPTNVKYILPAEASCWNCVVSSNIRNAPIHDTAIIGYGLDSLGEELLWSSSTPFRFSQIETRSGLATLIGCEHSIWSDAGGRVVYMLGKLGFKRVIYLGKVGSLRENIMPNLFLATGSESLVEGELVQWTNIFSHVTDENVIHGVHINSPSVLFETKEWVKHNRSTFDFVDPEIGQMAKFAESADVQFSYLHIISNSLVEEYSEDLSNERDEEVLRKRKHLLKNKVRGLIREI